MKRALLLICLLGVIFAKSSFALAKEKDREIIKLQEVIVTAPRIDKRLVETPAGISIITSNEIKEMGAKNIVDILETIPGVVKDSDTRKRATFRGNRSVQSAGALVLVNGIPANSGISGYVEYDAIPLADIDRIEVLRSSGSIAFGPDAARGIVNIITKRGKEGAPQVKIGASYGSWNTMEESAGVTGKVEDWDYVFGGSRLDTDGYENEEKKRSAAHLGVGYNFSENTRLGFNLARRDVNYQTSQKKTKWQVENYRCESIFPKSATVSTLEHYREDEDENIATSLNFTHEGEAFFTKAMVSYDDTDHLYKRYDDHLDPANIKNDYEEDRDEDRLSTSASGGYHFDFARMTFTPTLGVDYEKTNFDQTRTYPWADPVTKDSYIAKANIDTKRERRGLFLSNEFDFNEEWELNLGGRVDDVQYDIKNQQPKHVTKNVTDYSWNVTPAFHPTQDSTIYASASRSYWYPVLQYYKYAMEYGNAEYRPENLKPENYLTYELGYKHYFGSKLSLAVAGYHMKIKDKFLSFYDDTDVWRGYFNVGTSKHMGLELEASGRLSSFFGYRLSGAYQHAEWDEATFRAYEWGATPAGDTLKNLDISGRELPHVPEFTSTLGLDFYFMEYFKFSADVNYYGKQYIDVLNRYEMNDYVMVDSMLSYNRGKYKIWVLCNNIFDREVENIFNEKGDRNNDGTPNHYAYYPLEGVCVETGISFSF
ncbi:MAG: TonB-dependent receptor [Deltaproteobacteria bacterium]|nr:TonB-dependent receptor [Deltaproteobacteria bacterium]MBW2663586.1 TonB-dependent receptor [Deltaproteobacteria bacterium]